MPERYFPTKSQCGRGQTFEEMGVDMKAPAKQSLGVGLLLCSVVILSVVSSVYGQVQTDPVDSKFSVLLLYLRTPINSSITKHHLSWCRFCTNASVCVQEIR